MTYSCKVRLQANLQKKDKTMPKIIHNIVTNAEWPKTKRRNVRHTRQRIPRVPLLYGELEKMTAGQTVQVEMLKGEEADKTVCAVRNALINHRPSLKANFRTRTDIHDSVLTLSIQKKYGVIE